VAGGARGGMRIPRVCPPPSPSRAALEADVPPPRALERRRVSVVFLVAYEALLSAGRGRTVPAQALNAYAYFDEPLPLALLGPPLTRPSSKTTSVARRTRRARRMPGSLESSVGRGDGAADRVEPVLLQSVEDSALQPSSAFGGAAQLAPSRCSRRTGRRCPWRGRTEAEDGAVGQKDLAAYQKNPRRA
jgi:hypothetical protein